MLLFSSSLHCHWAEKNLLLVCTHSTTCSFSTAPAHTVDISIWFSLRSYCQIVTAMISKQRYKHMHPQAVQCDELSIKSRSYGVADQTFQIWMPEVTQSDSYLHIEGSLVFIRHAQASQLLGLSSSLEKGFLFRYLSMDFLPYFRLSSCTIFT